jgi:hypothetical protein
MELKGRGVLGDEKGQRGEQAKRVKTTELISGKWLRKEKPKSFTNGCSLTGCVPARESCWNMKCVPGARACACAPLLSFGNNCDVLAW